jgi:hypothetical protein
VKSWTPWLLVGAVLAAVAFAAMSPTSTSAPEPIAATPTPPPSPHGTMPLPADLPQEEDPHAGMGMAEAPGEPPAEEATLTGVVREHIDVSQYTYLRLATDAGETWAAVYRAPVKTGVTVTVQHATSIHGFRSTELGRDFPEIWFGMLPGYETAPAPSASAAPHDTSAGSKRPSGAITIADLAKGAAGLDGKEVTVSGKVVKENDGILGRNWIHLQDGSGTAADGSNDVLVTTDGTAKVGDALVATGTVRTNQDFGSGYSYKFMLEKAAVRLSP